MKVTLDLGDQAQADLVPAIVEAMRDQGLVVPAEGRTAPFGIAEMEEETGLSRSQIRRMVEAGTFEKVGETSRLLVKVASVRKWQGFEAKKKGGGNV